MSTLPPGILVPHLAHRFVVTFLELVNGEWTPLNASATLTSQVIACRVLNDVAKSTHSDAFTTEVSIIIEDDAANLVHRAIFEGKNSLSKLSKESNRIAIGVSYLDGDNKILRQTMFYNVRLETIQESDLNYSGNHFSTVSKSKIALATLSSEKIAPESMGLLNLIYGVLDGAIISTDTPKESSFYESTTHQFRLVFSVNPERVKTIYMNERT